MNRITFHIAVMASLFLTVTLFGQENCNFQPHIKKGSNYVFSTYLEEDYKTPLEGKCESYIQGQLYERREFLHGHLISEEANFQDGKPRILLKTYSDRTDDVIAELHSYWENGQPALYCLYYLDDSGRRCMKQTDYHLNGNKRFIQSYAFVRLSEINEYELKNHPPHTVDDQGYTSLMVPFGDEEHYSNEGVLISRWHHQLILSEFSRDASKDGPFTEFHDNGKVKTKGFYKDGNPSGNWVGYNYLGMKNLEMSYKDNILQGYYRTWYDNGQMQSEHFYDVTSNHPFQPAKKEWNEQGKLLLDLVLDKMGNGTIKKWNNEGVLLYETSIISNDYKKDIEIERFQDGQIKSILNHLPFADTSYVAYFPEGNMSEVHCVLKQNGERKMNIQKEWYSNGQLALEVEVNCGEPMTHFLQRKFDSSGNLTEQILQKGRERIEEKYASNGIKIRSRQTVDGKLEGPYQELDSLGNVLVTFQYHLGLRHGLCQRYNAKQALIFSQMYENGCPIQGKTNLNVKRTLSILEESERSYVNGLAYQQIFSNPKEHYSRKEIDSLAQWYSYVVDCVPFSKFSFPSTDVGEQLLFLRLPEGAFPGLFQVDTTNYRVKEIVKSFSKLGWELPKWNLDKGIYIAKIHLEGWYSPEILNTYFPFCQSWMEFAYTKENPRDIMVDYGMKRYHRQTSIKLSSVNSCLMKAALSIPFGSVSLLIYSDGEVEVENQQFTNEEILTENPNIIHEIGWD